MGLANLVPGISGGTMLLAAGIYTRVIESLAEVSRLRLQRDRLALLLAVAGAAGMAVLLLAGPVKDLVVEHRWVMYSLFVGLTLGGIPGLWRVARPGSSALWAGAGAGVIAMVALGLVQRSGAAAGTVAEPAFVPLFFAGLAGSASMILPGISGGYVLLVLGQYLTILGSIEQAADAIRAADAGALLAPVLGVFVPVGLGMGLGIAGVSNLLRWLLRRHAPSTLGLLLGLLAGAALGLWPFQEGVQPEPGARIKGEIVTADNRGLFDQQDWPVHIFWPTAGQAAGALGLILAGGAATATVARLGRGTES